MLGIPRKWSSETFSSCPGGSTLFHPIPTGWKKKGWGVGWCLRPLPERASWKSLPPFPNFVCHSHSCVPFYCPIQSRWLTDVLDHPLPERGPGTPPISIPFHRLKEARRHPSSSCPRRSFRSSIDASFSGSAAATATTATTESFRNCKMLTRKQFYLAIDSSPTWCYQLENLKNSRLRI